jgi:hypothetical protein
LRIFIGLSLKPLQAFKRFPGRRVPMRERGETSQKRRGL